MIDSITKALAMSTPFALFILIKGYKDVDVGSLFMIIIFIIIGILSIFKWVEDYRKNKFLKESLDWL